MWQKNREGIRAGFSGLLGWRDLIWTCCIWAPLMRTDRWRESGRRDHQVDEKLHLPRKEKVGLEEELGAVFFF